MYFTKFFHESAISDEIIEACGDRSVIILDGRLSKQTMSEISAIECKKRGYLAWQVWQGESFTRSRPVSQLWFVSNDKPVNNPAWLSAYGM